MRPGTDYGDPSKRPVSYGKWLWLFACISLVFVLTVTLALPAFAAPGDLDPTFDGDGTLTTDLGGADAGNDVALQSDGKIVVAGGSEVGTNQNFALLRYNTDGSLDTSFDGDGIVSTDIGNGRDDNAHSVAIQSDGKIVVGGAEDAGSLASLNFALARYNTDGTLDTSFDGDGIVTTDFVLKTDRINSIAIQPDGKIVAAGYSATTRSDFALARYNTDGTLDTSFDGDGRLTTTFGFAAASMAFHLVVQTDGKIVVSGYAIMSSGSAEDFALARYNTDGSLDTSFDSDGMATTDFGGGGMTNEGDSAYSVAVQPNGKIIAAGTARTATGLQDFAMARYLVNGQLDSSFGTGGTVTTEIGGQFDYALDMVFQSNNKVMLAGTGSLSFALARYDATGALDTSFNGDGLLTTSFGTTAQANGVALQPDGRLVAVGLEGAVSTSDVAAARYDGDVLSTPTPTATNTPTATPTRTSTPTATRTSTTTPTAPPVSIVGHVTWQGIPQPDARNNGIPARLVLCIGGVLNQYGVSTDASGFFTVTATLVNGSYPWGIKGELNLANTGNLTISGPSNAVEMGLLKAGDSNNTNVVNTTDFNIVKATFGRAFGQPGYDARGDFNKDSTVSVTDFTLLRGNFGVAGAAFSCP